MDNNGSDYREPNYGGGYYYGEPRWSDFTLDDEKRAKSRFSKFFLALFVFTLASNVAAMLIETFILLAFGEAKALQIFDSYWYLWAMNIAVMYVIAFPVFYLIIRKMRTVNRYQSKIRASEFFALLMVGEAFMYLGSIVGTWLNSFFSIFVGEMPENTTSELIMNSPIWIVIIVAVIIGPIVEELMFRKLMIDRLSVYGDKIAIIVSSIAFGIFHGNFYQFFYAALLGLVLGYVYTKTANIVYPIIMHMFINFWGSIIPLLINKPMERYYELAEQYAIGEAIDMTEFSRLTLIVGGYAAVQLAMVIAGAVIFFKRRKRVFISDRCEVTIPKQRRVAVILGNVGAILFLVISGITMILNIISPLFNAAAA